MADWLSILYRALTYPPACKLYGLEAGEGARWCKTPKF